VLCWVPEISCGGEFGSKQGKVWALRDSDKQKQLRKVWLVSADSRRLVENDPNTDAACWLTRMAALTLVYATTHGYHYVRFACEHETLLRHPKYGARSPAWLKLLAIFEVMTSHARDDDLVMWIDSDGTIQQQNQSIERSLQSLSVGCGADVASQWPMCQTNATSGFNCTAVKDEAHLFTFSNYPFCHSPGHSGFFVFRNTAIGRQLLSDWWDTDWCNTAFPWEQGALNALFHPLSRYRYTTQPSIAVLHEHPNTKGLNVFGDPTMYTAHFGE
jgi:hypothetical protein